MLKVIFSPVNIIFVIAAAYFGAQAYLWQPTLINKLIFYGIVALWVFWIIARYMIYLFVALALVGGGYYAYYQYSTREIRKCEDAGGVWNKETQTCEAKKSLLEKITSQVDKLFTDIFQTQPKQQPKPAENTPSTEQASESSN